MRAAMNSSARRCVSLGARIPMRSATSGSSDSCAATRAVSPASAGVWSASSVSALPMRVAARVRPSRMCSAAISAACRVTSAVTCGLPSRSPPIQVPKRTNAGACTGARPASSPCSRSSSRRYTCGTISNRVWSKTLMAVRTSSSGVGRVVRSGEVRSRVAISSSRRRSFSARAVAFFVRSRSSMRSVMRRTPVVTARRRASVGWAVRTGWNRSPSRRAAASSAPTCSTSSTNVAGNESPG